MQNRFQKFMQGYRNWNDKSMSQGIIIYQRICKLFHAHPHFPFGFRWIKSNFFFLLNKRHLQITCQFGWTDYKVWQSYNDDSRFGAISHPEADWRHEHFQEKRQERQQAAQAENHRKHISQIGKCQLADLVRLVAGLSCQTLVDWLQVSLSDSSGQATLAHQLYPEISRIKQPN